MESWRCHMKHNLEERMDIGRRMYLHEITYKEAMEIYGLSESCAHKYMTDYKYQISMLISYVKQRA